MRYFLRSIATFSFWRYALLSGEALASLLAWVGGTYLFMEILDFLSIYTRDRYSRFAIIPILLVSALIVVFTRRPVTRITYRVPGRDYRFEVKIADLFAEPCDLVISTSTTFDTDIASGLIAADSLQGQLTLRLFQGSTAEIDRQIEDGLKGLKARVRKDAPGRKKDYPIGTVVPVRIPGRTFYFVAMSRLNAHGTASSSVRNVEEALSKLWDFVAEQGELRDIAIPLMGTGRGRLELPRKKMVEKIAQSFADASREKIFSGRLVVVVRSEDAANFGVNLFEVRDYLARSLHA